MSLDLTETLSEAYLCINSEIFRTGILYRGLLFTFSILENIRYSKVA